MSFSAPRSASLVLEFVTSVCIIFVVFQHISSFSLSVLIPISNHKDIASLESGFISNSKWKCPQTHRIQAQYSSQNNLREFNTKTTCLKQKELSIWNINRKISWIRLETMNAIISKRLCVRAGWQCRVLCDKVTCSISVSYIVNGHYFQSISYVCE